MANQINTDLSSTCVNCTVSVTFDMPEALLSVNYLRKKARLMMDILDIDPQDVGDLEIILGELATNVVRHAKGSRLQVHLTVDRHGNQATITVVDDGVGFTPDALPAPGTPRSATLAEEEGVVERIGGYGLPLVRTIADMVDITTNEEPLKGMSVRAIKNLQSLP
jgi:anti-sigma regulatory factor (Ser/Thr protein kinase)